MKDNQSMHMHLLYVYTRNGSCVGSNIRIGSWSVSIPIQELTVVLNAEGGTDSALRLLHGETCRLFF